MKKIAPVFLASITMIGGVCGIASCKDNEETTKTVMNVSLNPEVEFILDADNKVVSVNALNEEGNLIVSAEAFANVEGKTAEEAATLFVQVSKETGYLVEGKVSAGDNEISVSLSGDEKAAEELYEDVKNKVNEYLTEVDVTATIGYTAALSEAYLKDLVAECAPYLETAEMEYAELVDTLAQSRKETAEFYSQELKNAYYEAKAFAMQQAELETLRGHLSVVQQGLFDVTNALYTASVESIENTRKTLLVDENSLYQVALKTFREVKTEYLKARTEFSLGDVSVTVEITEEQLAAKKKAVEDAEAALLNAGVEANKTLDNLKAAVTENYNKVVEKLEEYSVKANEHLEEIATKRQNAQATFYAEFETKYASVIISAETNWADMKADLEDSSEAE